ncbi:MAG: glutathione S-transferase family protein [Devosia sp.]|jgi:glutathione S-transferase|uniref:glutathione S-transferase family protein n=1 Tax=unclassified Devosia TaxID=196773 RepID=UPI000925B716|nr:MULTISPECIES: glutathione S-transferase family protein [unclassified Devosia]MBL8597283.1 glutathione S-transferase family protein [Devosia sp.]MBN9347610.1 glutathione S-transferase family protein [Devosia sp.]OJX53053.1 MAG: glutathione S-transferase [Devosia sp. 66-22]
MLRVLGRTTSINVRKVLWAAGEMGLAYEQEVWGNPDRDPNVPEFLALNPNAQVPVLVDDGFVLWESNAIMRYLAEKTGSDLLPADRRERALVDQWLTWTVSELNPSWGYAVYALLRKRPEYNDQGRVQASIDAWNAKMAIIDAQLARPGGFVTNGRFSLADIAIALATHRWLSTPFDKPDRPAVVEHYAKMQSRPAGKPYLGATTP